MHALFIRNFRLDTHSRLTFVSLSPPSPPACSTLPRRVVIKRLSTRAPLRHCTETTRSSPSSTSTRSTGLSLSELHLGDATHIVATAGLEVCTSKKHCTPLTKVSPVNSKMTKQISDMIGSIDLTKRSSDLPKQISWRDANLLSMLLPLCFAGRPQSQTQ